LIGIENYAPILQEKSLKIDNLIFPTGETRIKNVSSKISSFEIDHKIESYEFLTPWIALNQENYLDFEKLDEKERKIKLEKILIGNILSFLKGVNCFIDWKLEVKLGEIKTVKVKVHRNEFVGFLCEFEANISLPELIGVGKSVSKGFGTIGRLK
jgi:hypothetical protein